MIHLTRREALLALGLSVSGGLCRPIQPARADAFDLALQGQELLTRGKYSEAIEVLKQATQTDNESEWAWGLLGRAFFQSDQMRPALHAFQQVLRINPEDTYSRMLVDVITQKPLPPEPETVKPLSPLEQRAQAEEQEIFKTLQAQKGLGYRIRRIVLDPGHGGFDSGAVGLNKLQEKEVTLDLARQTASILRDVHPDLRIFLTRSDDYYVPLSARTTIANQFNADLFISFHINANENRQPHGMETYFCSETASSQEAARVAQFENAVLQLEEETAQTPGHVNIEDILFHFERRRYWEAGGAVARGLQGHLAESLSFFRNRGVHSANFFVLRRARMPSILLETGFISNPNEEKILADTAQRLKISESIAAAVLELARTGV